MCSSSRYCIFFFSLSLSLLSLLSASLLSHRRHSLSLHLTLPSISLSLCRTFTLPLLFFIFLPFFLFLTQHATLSPTLSPPPLLSLPTQHTQPMLEAVVLFQSLDASDLYQSLESQQEKEAISQMRERENILKEYNLEAKHTTAIMANKLSIKETLIDYVNAASPDLFILGSRGLGAVKRVFVGSVSDYCMHHVECPVMIHKVQKRE